MMPSNSLLPDVFRRFTHYIPYSQFRSSKKYDDSQILHSYDPEHDPEAVHLEHQKFVKKTISSDGRLHGDIPLYGEGFERTCCRGWLHFICALILPLGMYHLIIEANGNMAGIISSVTYVTMNIFCYGCSGLYHIGRWSPKVEIVLQKLDHSGIAILSVGTFIPVTVLILMPSHPRIAVIFLLSSFCCALWTIYNIFQLRPSSIRQVLVVATIFPVLPTLYTLMNNLEFNMTIACMVFQAIGLLVFTIERPNPLPSIFGFHEIFHIFVVLAGLCVYIANWSIVRRTCNPYSHNVDVSKVISDFFSEVIPFVPDNLM